MAACSFCKQIPLPPQQQGTLLNVPWILMCLSVFLKSSLRCNSEREREKEYLLVNSRMWKEIQLLSLLKKIKIRKCINTCQRHDWRDQHYNSLSRCRWKEMLNFKKSCWHGSYNVIHMITGDTSIIKNQVFDKNGQVEGHSVAAVFVVIAPGWI